MSKEIKLLERTKEEAYAFHRQHIQSQIHILKQLLEFRINLTPTGPEREMWTVVNIHILEAEATLQKGPIIKRCLVCGTTDNLHEDRWMGQTVYRCNSTDCMEL